MSFGDLVGVLGLVLALLGVAISILWPDQRPIGWVALVLAGAICLIWVTHALKRKLGRTRMTLALAIIAGGLIGAMVGALVWLAPAKGEKEAPVTAVPEVTLRFVYPQAPALVLINKSAAIARDIKWTVVLWNADLPDRNDPLPIPTSTFDWIRPVQQGGPVNLFSAPAVSSLLKPGNRLYGSASVICPDCGRGHTYLVYMHWGQGGWFYDVENERSGQLLIPPDFTKEKREAYFKEIEVLVPQGSRVPIGDR